MGELEAATHNEEATVSLELLKLGNRLGLAAALALWALWDCVLEGMLFRYRPDDEFLSIDSLPGFGVLCGLFGLLVLHWSWGVQVYVWTRFRINYIYM